MVKRLTSNKIVSTAVGIAVPNILLSQPMIADSLRIGNLNFAPIVRAGITLGLLGNLVKGMQSSTLKTVASAGLVLAGVSSGLSFLPAFLGSGSLGNQRQFQEA